MTAVDPESIYYIVASITAPIAAAWALIQWRLAVSQRRKELRWRKSEAAWHLLDQAFDDPDSLLALEVIDGERDYLQLDSNNRTAVNIQSIRAAIDLSDPSNSTESRSIRYSLNCILYNFDRIEMAIRSGFVEQEDVASPTTYYAIRIAALEPMLRDYCTQVGYTKAHALISRLNQTENSP